MSKYIEKVENGVYPVIPLRGLVIFPGIPTSFEINNKKSIKALLAAASYENTVFLSTLYICVIRSYAKPACSSVRTDAARTRSPAFWAAGVFTCPHRGRPPQMTNRSMPSPSFVPIAYMLCLKKKEGADVYARVLVA